MQAEPKITEAALELAGTGRRQAAAHVSPSAGPAHRKRSLELKPIAYWRLDEFAGPRAADSAGRTVLTSRRGVLPGRAALRSGSATDGETNRAPHFVGRTASSPVADARRSLHGVAVALERHARQGPRSGRLACIARTRSCSDADGRPPGRRRRRQARVSRRGRKAARRPHACEALDVDARRLSARRRRGAGLSER